MKRWLLIAVVITLATAALADTVTLQLVSTPYGTTGPYGMKVDGSVQQLVCGSDLQRITLNETWTAMVYDINDVTTNPYFTTQTQGDWNYAALFANLLLQNPGIADLQNDVWAALHLGGTFDVYWKGIVDTFLAGHPGYLTEDVFYIPIQIPGDYQNDPNYPYGLPQPFIGIPEPSSLVLFGSGLLAAAGVVRRRLRV